MLIENPDAFKSWLTTILEPLCDADPAALAKYVYALVKKDKMLDELRESMVDQLDVFLQHETKPFVDMLFKSLDSQEYLKAVSEEERPSHTDEVFTELEKEAETDIHASPITNGAVDDRPSGGLSRPRSPPAAAPPRHRVVVSRAPERVAAAAPPPLARAPPREQTLVKLMPLTELLEEPVDPPPPKRRDRRGDGPRDKVDRRRRRSRSWERRARARRHAREPDHERRYEKRRALSRSPSPRGRYRNRSPPPPPAAPGPASRSRSRSPVPAVRDRDLERERALLRLPRELERDRMSRDREHRDRLSRSRDRERSRERSRDRSPSPRLEPRPEHADAFKRRCRDFDEKGYCMRGDLCQWDHGTDPVVLEDAALTRVLTIPPPVPEYNPLAPDIWCAPGFPQYAPPHPPHAPHGPHAAHAPRELIPIPRLRHDAPPLMGALPPPMPPHAPRHPHPHTHPHQHPLKKNFDYNRLGKGPVRHPMPPNAANCSLEVKKVPRGLNDITHLNNHFGKFGKIVNIQVCFEGDPEGALITFANPTEANVAYKSTEAVLNNRFIKVFWHNHENKLENTSPSGQNNKQNSQQQQQQDRPNSQQHFLSQNKVLINRDNMKATADNKLQLAEKQPKAPPPTTNGQEPKKEPPKPAEKNKQVMDMHKRAQALLETQLQQQRLMLQRLESGNVTGAQKTALMEAINSAQEGIEKLRKELVAYNKTLRQMQSSKKPKSREEAQKEILDAELDMFTKQQEGQDVTELAKKIADLRRQMTVQFPHPTIRRQHSRGGRFNTATRFTRGAPTPKVFTNQSVDHRPRALLVSGFESDELDALLVHFTQFGEVTGKEVNLAVPELTLQYKARAQAEQAALRGRNYNDRTLSVTWVTSSKPLSNAAPPAAPAPPAPPAARADSIDDSKDLVAEPTPELSEAALLRFDEEDEEEAEARSWRR